LLVRFEDDFFDALAILAKLLVRVVDRPGRREAAVRHAVTEASRADDRGPASVAHPPARGDAVFLAHESADVGGHAHYVTFECLAPHEAR
jgi:hypothetical protein